MILVIASSIVGVGEGINRYGTSVRNATAPNSGGAVATKRVEAKPKPSSKVGDKKGLPATSERKALPSTNPMKALPAPPAKKDALPKANSAYTPYQAPVAVKKQEKDKSGTLSSGKVVPQSSALPKDSPFRAKTLQTSAAVNSPYPVKAPSLNLPASKSPKPSTASKAGSVAGGQQKNLAIPGFGLPGGKTGGTTSSRAQTVVNGGNKTASKPPPSKAGSVAGSYAKGGPSFF